MLTNYYISYITRTTVEFLVPVELPNSPGSAEISTCNMHPNIDSDPTPASSSSSSTAQHKKRIVNKGDHHAVGIPSKKKKMSKDDEIGECIIQSLKSIEENRHALAQKQEDDEDQLFGRQVAITLHRFTSRQKAMAKLRMQQVLIDVEFPE
jgi:hypothetical protein